LATDAGLIERRAELQTRGRRTSKALESNLQNGIDRKACSRSWLTGRRTNEDQSNRPNLHMESEEHSSRPRLAKSANRGEQFSEGESKRSRQRTKPAVQINQAARGSQRSLGR
jgi:hypothetical protein